MPSSTGMCRSMRTTSGRSAADALQRRGTVPGLTDDLDLGAHLEQHGQRLAEQRLVVDEQHPHGRRAHPGTATRSVVP